MEMHAHSGRHKVTATALSAPTHQERALLMEALDVGTT